MGPVSEPPPGAGPGAPRAAIDVDAGVDRVMGDRVMFMRVLDRFRSDYRSAAASIQAALADGAAQAAQRLAHTLKGASGMIEATALQHRAAALEQALRAHPQDCRVQLEQVEAELERVLHEVDALLLAGAESAPAAPRPEAASAGAEPLVRLRTALDMGDGAAVGLLEDARGPLEHALGAARAGQVAAAINDFDFELALRLLGGATDVR